MTPRRYQLQLSRSQWIGLYWPALALTLVPLPLVFDEISQASISRSVVGFFLLAAVFWWSALTLPHRIDVLPTGTLQFVSRLRCQSVEVADIHSVGPAPLNLLRPFGGMLTLRHRRGKIQFMNQFSDMRFLLGEIQAMNPMVQLTAC
jgi:hypothetical protein